MALTDTGIKALKPSGKTKAGDKHSDGEGLHLLVTPKGSKLWRLSYRFAGRQRTLALGGYPEVSLADARKGRTKARELLAQGIDPNAAKRAEKLAKRVAAADTFEATARELHAVKASSWSPQYAERWIQRMEKDLFPLIGYLTLPEISAPILLDALRRVEKRGAHETAHSLRQTAGAVFRYGIQTGRCQTNPVPDLKDALKPVVPKHMAAILDPAKVGELMRAIDGYTGQPATRAALQLSALLFQRPGNIRALEWSWVDLDKKMVTIPAEAMKRRVGGKINGRPHLVPLAPQAVAVLQEMHALTGRGRYVFPGMRSHDRPMSENTVNAALRRMGFSSSEMTAHGFRAMARTLIAERFPDIHQDAIEAQLAHGKSGPLGMAYDRAQYLAQRKKMMRLWADYLDELRDGAQVISITRAA